MRKVRIIPLLIAGVFLMGAFGLTLRGTWVTATVFVAYTPIQPGAPAMSDDAVALRDQVAQTMGDAADGVSVSLVSNSLHRLVIHTKPNQTSALAQNIDAAIRAISDAQRQAYRLQLREMEEQLTMHHQNILQRKLEIEMSAWSTDPTLMTLQQRLTATEIQQRLVREELAAVMPEYRITHVMVSSPFDPVPVMLVIATVLAAVGLFGVKRHD